MTTVTGKMDPESQEGTTAQKTTARRPPPKGFPLTSRHLYCWMNNYNIVKVPLRCFEMSYIIGKKEESNIANIRG
jgi:hypothetical protein